MQLVNNPIFLGVAGLVIGLIAGWLVFNFIGTRRKKESEQLARRIIEDAEKESQIKKKEAILEAKDEWYKAKANFEREMQNKKLDVSRTEKRLAEREENLDRKVDILNKKEREIKNRERIIFAREKAISARDTELNRLLMEQNKQLERIAGMSADEAKKLLLANLADEARQEAAQLVKEIKEEAERTAEKEAKNIIIQAIQRCAADQAAESTVSVVSLPSDEMKGRIIGREGRNIRSFEIATGVDVIVDDTPEAVILSGYDPIRREVARMALEKLVTDGRIHPARIEEIVAKCEKEMEVIIRELGEQACFDCGVHGLHVDIVRLLGKLNFRTSYGQNVLQHSKEVSFLCGIMAAELGLDPVIARRAGLLHDIGKAVDRDTEGTHTQIGVNLISKYNESRVILNAIESHHEDVVQETPYSVLVQAADAVSGARPGARRETLEGYIKRLEKLEEIADSFKGVGKAYAIQAGREVRVMVEANQVSDAAADELASEIARKIQAELEYPGQIKVTVIRETRAVDYAR
ncbi:MAG: ribonuclease Y [candidate division Zixibacteria bacterium CG_4_9_14_3_um_filter_46_8]|nr:MAG: ribonuclease Y [candidate division Zixibacteria bacterium CG_4_9_14_3_um_filter_46_8]